MSGPTSTLTTGALLQVPAYRNDHCRVKEYEYQGYPLVILENELLLIAVLAGKGADLCEFLYKPSDTEFLLHTPRGVRAPALLGPSPGRSPFIDYYEGGWQEILPNGGPPCSYGGVEFCQHDEVSTLPWDYRVELNTRDEVRVAFSVRPFRTPFHLERRMVLRSAEARLTIEETLTNEGAETLDFMWGHHPAFGAPFLGPQCHVDLPAGDLELVTFAGDAGGTRVAPGRHAWPLAPLRDGEGHVDYSRPDEPNSGQEDLGYVVNLPEGWCALTNQATGVGCAMAWSLDTFPYLWVWRQFNRSTGYPWFGQVYTLALEPWSSYPSAGLAAAVENGTAARLGPGEQRSTQLHAMAFHGARRIAHVAPDGSLELVPVA